MNLNRFNWKRSPPLHLGLLFDFFFIFVEINHSFVLFIFNSRQPNLEGLTPKFDLNLFIDAQARTAQMIHENSALELATTTTTTATKMANDSNEMKTSEQNFDENQEIQQQKKKPGIETIIFGKHEISVWYNSQYSDEFQNCLRLYICEFCLKCMNSSIILDRHMEKCTLKHPPGK